MIIWKACSCTDTNLWNWVYKMNGVNVLFYQQIDLLFAVRLSTGSLLFVCTFNFSIVLRSFPVIGCFLPNAFSNTSLRSLLQYSTLLDRQLLYIDSYWCSETHQGCDYPPSRKEDYVFVCVCTQAIVRAGLWGQQFNAFVSVICHKLTGYVWYVSQGKQMRILTFYILNHKYLRRKYLNGLNWIQVRVSTFC